MAAWRTEAAIIRVAWPPPWQYRVQLPGLLGQPFPLWINRSDREISRAMAHRLAPAHRRISHLARALVRARHRRLCISVERLGQAPQPRAGHGEFHRLGHPPPARADA